MWDSPEVVPVIDGFEAVPRVPANSIYHNKSQRAAVDNGKLGERGGRNLECEFVIHMQPRRYMLTWWSMGRDLTGGWIWVHVGAARTLPLEGCGLFAGGGGLQIVIPQQSMSEWGFMVGRWLAPQQLQRSSFACSADISLDII